jgi:hypothetical protein
VKTKRTKAKSIKKASGKKTGVIVDLTRVAPISNKTRKILSLEAKKAVRRATKFMEELDRLIADENAPSDERIAAAVDLTALSGSLAHLCERKEEITRSEARKKFQKPLFINSASCACAFFSASLVIPPL